MAVELLRLSGYVRQFQTMYARSVECRIWIQSLFSDFTEGQLAMRWFVPLPVESDESLWDALASLPRKRSLAATIATALIINGMRSTHARRMCRLKRSWASETVLQVVLSYFVKTRSIDWVSTNLGLNKKRLLLAARSLGVHYRNRRPTKAEIHEAMLLVIDKDYSFRSASEASGISRSALHRYVQRHRERLSDRVSTELKIRPASWRCPIHGPVTVMPCVACAALASKRRQLTAAVG